MLIQPTTLPGRGFSLPTVDFTVTNRSGATYAVGDVIQADEGATQAETTSIDPGGNGVSIYDNTIAPDALGIRSGFQLVVSVGCIDNAVGRAAMMGIIDKVFVIASSGSIALNAATRDLGATVTKELTPISSAEMKITGKARTAHTTPTTRVLGKATFNGYTGFGVQVS